MCRLQQKSLNKLGLLERKKEQRHQSRSPDREMEESRGEPHLGEREVG